MQLWNKQTNCQPPLHIEVEQYFTSFYSRVFVCFFFMNIIHYVCMDGWTCIWVFVCVKEGFEFHTITSIVYVLMLVIIFFAACLLLLLSINKWEYKYYVYWSLCMCMCEESINMMFKYKLLQGEFRAFIPSRNKEQQITRLFLYFLRLSSFSFTPF